MGLLYEPHFKKYDKLLLNKELLADLEIVVIYL